MHCNSLSTNYLGKLLTVDTPDFSIGTGESIWQGKQDISCFYRGASLKPVFLNPDNGIYMRPTDKMYLGRSKPWLFENRTMGWQAASGTHVMLNNEFFANHPRYSVSPYFFQEIEELKYHAKTPDKQIRCAHNVQVHTIRSSWQN